MWKAVKGAFSIIAGVAAFFCVIFVTSYVLNILTGVPFLRSILFFPSDAGWARIVIPPSASVFAGAYVGKMICGSTKPFSIFAILIYALNLALGFVAGQLTGIVVGTAVIVFISAAICISE